MKMLKHVKLGPPMFLGARNAADLMTPNPVSIRHSATVPEAAAFLAARGISAAPVIDEAGRPVGVVSRTDILQHKNRRAIDLVVPPNYDGRLARPSFSDGAAAAEPIDQPVRDVMTPAVFCVTAETPVAKLVEKMVSLEVRRLFVVDEDGVLVGVVSAIDVMRKLRRCH